MDDFDTGNILCLFYYSDNTLLLYKSPVKVAQTIVETIQPIFIESYRIIYVGRKNKFALALEWQFFGLYETLLLLFFAIIFAYKIIANCLFRKILNGLFEERAIVFSIISGCLGQGQIKHSKLISSGILFTLFTFFVYINYVMQSGFIISCLTTDPPVKFKTISAVQKSEIPIYISEYDYAIDIHQQLKIK